MENTLHVTAIKYVPAHYGDNCGHDELWEFSVILPHRKINYSESSEEKAVNIRNDWLTISQETLDFIVRNELW